MGNASLNTLAKWSGFIYLQFFGLGWLLLARFWPPISPTVDALGVASRFKEDNTLLMVASVVMMCSTIILTLFNAAFVKVIYHIEQKFGLLTISLILTGAMGLILNFYMPFSFSVAAFRPDRNPELIQLMTDIGFMMFMGGIPLFIMGWFIAAYAILVVSPRKNPLLPRWFGYLNLWTGILYIPELLIFFFKTGPFAWDGIVGYWIPAILFIIYFLATPFVLGPALKRIDEQ